MDYSIKGMTCAACANSIEKRVNSYLKNEETKAVVNYATERLSSPVELDLNILNKELAPLGYQILEKNSEEGIESHRYDLWLTLLWLFLSGFIFMIEMGPLHHHFSRDTSWKIQFLISTPIIFIGGRQYLQALIPFFTKGASNMNTLVGLGTLSAYLYSSFLTWFYDYSQSIKLGNMVFFEAASFIVSFVLLGKYFEKKAKTKAKYEFENLLSLNEKDVTVLRNNIEEFIPQSQIEIGDLLVLRPGEMVAVDGEVKEGESHLEESMITGEPLPKYKTVGDKIFSGTINNDGRIIYQAIKVGKDTVLSGIIESVGKANEHKAPIQKLADKISSVFVPVVVLIAFFTLAIWLFWAKVGVGHSLSYFIAVLVIACPCALGLATPTAVLIATSRASKFGLLLEGGGVIEKGSHLTTILFDKTGTLTHGTPEVISFVMGDKWKKEELLSFTHSLEFFSEHPLAKALLKYCEREASLITTELESFEVIRGKGIKGSVSYNGRVIEILVGAKKWLKELNISTESFDQKTKEHGSKSYIVIDNEIHGMFVVGDKIKDEAKIVISHLKSRGVTPWLVTGDNREIAEIVAKNLGIENVRAEVLPEDKLALVKELKSKGEIVAMIGDGLNDAPALAESDLSFAMSAGSDLAKQTSDVIILGGNLKGLIDFLTISKKSLRVIKENLFFSFFYNALGIPLAAGAFIPLFGIAFPPMFAGFAMGASSITVVLNSLRLLRMKRFNPEVN